VTGQEDPALAAMDADIRAQLLGAAQTYSSKADLHARLAAILEAGHRNGNGKGKAADS
jgi:hypothetical protein